MEINDESRETYYSVGQTRFETSMLSSSLCNYSDEYIFESGSIKITKARTDNAATKIDRGHKGVIFKNFEPLTECRNGINNTQKDYTKNLNFMMLIYNLIQ